MNFFKHHIGDYAAATSHLTWDEDMAYTRLMRVYYQHEKAIPADLAQACRLARATTPAQKRAVEAVLQEFFTLEEDGWHQKRCDEEIAAMQKRAEQNREIGKRGGRPKKQKQEPNENPNGFQDETQTVSEKNPSQNPLATSQSNSDPDGSDAGASQPAAGLDAKDALWQIAVPWMVERQAPEKSARSLLGAAVKLLGDDGAWQLAQRMMAERPMEPATWLAAALNAQAKAVPTTGKGGAHAPNRQEALEIRNRQIAAQVAAEIMGNAQ